MAATILWWAAASSASPARTLTSAPHARLPASTRTTSCCASLRPLDHKWFVNLALGSISVSYSVTVRSKFRLLCGVLASVAILYCIQGFPGSNSNSSTRFQTTFSLINCFLNLSYSFKHATGVETKNRCIHLKGNVQSRFYITVLLI